MNANDLKEMLKEMIAQVDEHLEFSDSDDPRLDRIEDFEERGYLTRDKGFAVCFDNGDEFHIVVTKTKGEGTGR